MPTQPGPAPLVSVVMAVRNGGPFVAEAVESILGQTAGDFEFVAVDDGSTDDTPDVLRNLAARDARLRVLSGPNVGITKALNRGQVDIRGEFIARMDGDDVALPDRFARQLEYLRQHPDVVVCGTGHVRIDAAGNALSTTAALTDHDAILAELLDGRGGAILHPSMMVRTSAMRQVGGYREQFRYAQDLDLYLHLAQIGRLGNLAEPLLKYRKHGNSVTVSRWKAMHAEGLAIVHDGCARLGRPVPANLLHWHVEGGVYDHAQVGWRAVAARQWKTARQSAAFLLRYAPGRGKSWRLAAHAAIGPVYAPLRDAVRRRRASKPSQSA